MNKIFYAILLFILFDTSTQNIMGTESRSDIFINRLNINEVKQNIELSEAVNDSVFILLNDETDNLINALKKNKDKRDFILKEIENPISDSYHIMELIDKVKQCEFSFVRKKVLRSLQEARNKYN